MAELAEIIDDDLEKGIVNALKVNGFTEEQVRFTNNYSLKESIGNFIKWSETCKEKTLAGHNVVFDVSFLKDSAYRSEIEWPLFLGRPGVDRSVDLHSLCYSHYLKRKLTTPIKNTRSDINIDKVLNYVGLPNEPRPHNALRGTKFEAESFSRLIYGKGLLKEFQEYKIPKYLLEQLNQF